MNPINQNINFKINIIFVRHATSCANLINKGLGKGLLTPGQWARDSDITRIGIQECLQLADFLECARLRGADYINGNAIGINDLINYRPDTEEKPVTLFACSELRRTSETIFTSFLRYLPNYFNERQKIIVLPWLNEERAIGKMDKDNEAESQYERDASWRRYIKNLKRMFSSDEFKKDLGNDAANMIDKLKIEYVDSWNGLFYKPKHIYGDRSSEFKERVLKANYEDPKEMLNNLQQIIYEYLKNYNPEKLQDRDLLNVNLVMVGHSHSGIGVLSAILPSLAISLEKQQLVNCEIVKLPAIITTGPGKFKYSDVSLLSKTANTNHYRLFPFGFYQKVLKLKSKIPYSTDSLEMFRYYIFYASKFNIFFSLFNLIQQKFYVEKKETENSSNFLSTSYLNQTARPKNATKMLEISTPLTKFLDMPYANYLKELLNMIKTLDKLRKFFAHGTYFYNFYNLYIIAIKNRNMIYKEAKKFEDLLKADKSKEGVIQPIEQKLEEIIKDPSTPNNKKVDAQKIYLVRQRDQQAKQKKDVKYLTVGDVFGLENLHKYFFDGCEDKLTYLCQSCATNNQGKVTDEFTLTKIGIKQKPFLQ